MISAEITDAMAAIGKKLSSKTLAWDPPGYHSLAIEYSRELFRREYGLP